MQNYKYNIIIEQGVDGYLISSVVELPGCHTQAKTQIELMRRTKAAIEVYLENSINYVPLNRFLSLQQISV